MEESSQTYQELQPGTGLCGGKYIVEKKIGEGGFGITYKAVQAGLNRAVCIKEYFLAGGCIRDTYAKTIHLQGVDEAKFERYRQAFVKEAQTLASLHHQGIVEVIDIFNENNTSYMVMPFIEGRSLQSIVEKNGPLPYPEAVNYIAQVANAVGYIHDRHILHRDIKPDNIMITADLKAVLIDFGSAREFEEDKTQAHTSMLTHGYAPTEQYTRNSRKGAYTDIYALGATLYFVLTGQVPVEAAARITEPMPEPRELNPALPEEANRTIMKAMQLKSQDRHQSIHEFMDDLLNVNPSAMVEQGSPEVQPEQIPAADQHNNTDALKEQEKGSKKTWLMPVIVVTVLVLGGSLSFLLFHKSPLEKEAEQAVPKYRALVSEVNTLMDEGSNSHPLPWLQADSIVTAELLPMENAYCSVMPDEYNKSQRIKKRLSHSMSAAAEVWAEHGLTQLKVYRDYDQAVQCYELSLRLRENAEIRAEYNDVLTQRNENANR